MTTTSIPLADLSGGDRTRRDRWGRYMVLAPGEDKPVGYTRMTTVAKALDSGWGLPPWKATLAICGLMMRPGLRAQWEALLAETQGNPWYAGEASKAECKALVEECAAMGGANDRREIGTSLHRIAALMQSGQTPTNLSPETARDLKALNDGLAAEGIKVLIGQVELMVVLDAYRVAGRFDFLAEVPGFELPLVADLKTGASLDNSWNYFATQLAGYSRADAIYRQGAAEDGSEDERTPMPAVDQDNGLIVWLNAGTGNVELHLVDLRAGWESFGHSMWARAWAKTEVGRPFAEGGWHHDLVADLAASVEALQAAQTCPQINPQTPKTGAAPPGTDEPGHAGEDVPYTVALRAWLQERINDIGTHETARDDLMRVWPAGLPSLRSDHVHGAEELAVIEKLCNDVERRHEIPFPPPRPEPTEADAEAMVLQMFPNATPTTEVAPT